MAVLWQQEGRKMEWTYVYTRGIPIEAQYLYRKAREFADLEKYETALRYFRQAVIIAPRYAKAVCEMGNCLEKLGQQYEAVVLYERALSIDPLNTDAQFKKDQLMKGRVPDGTDMNSREHQPFSRSSELV